MSAEPTAPAARRWPRRLAIAAGGVAALLVLVRVLLPTAIERGAAWAGPRYLGLPVRIDNVDLSLLRGRVTIEGLAIGSRADAVLPPAAPAEAAARAGASEAPAAGEPLLRWERVFAELDWTPLLSRTLQVGTLDVDAPRVRLGRQPNGRIDPLAHARPTAPPSEPQPEPAEPQPPGEPWTLAIGKLALRNPDLRIADEASGEVLVQLGLEELDLERVGLRGAALDLGGVGIRGPVLRVRRDLVSAAPAAPAAEPAPAAAPAPSRPGESAGYRVEQIAIERAEFVWVDDAGPLDVALTLNARDVSANQGERFPLHLVLEIEDGRLELDGQAGLLPPAFEGKVAWTQLPLPPLLLASSPELGRWLRSGRSTADLQVKASLANSGQEPPGVRVSGQLGLDGLAIADPKGEEVALGWRELDVAIHDAYAPLPQDGAPPATTRVTLDHVRLVGPDVRYAPPTPSLDALLGGGSAAAAAQAAPATPAPSAPAPAGEAPPPASPPAAAAAAGGVELDVAALEVGDVRLRYEDRSGEKPLTASVDGLGVEAGTVALRTAGGAPHVTAGSLSVKGRALAFSDERGAAPRRGSVEGLVLALAGIEAAGGASPSAAVQTFALDGQAIHFEDDTVEPPYRGRLRDLVARAQELRFPERVARSLKVTGASADGGRFELVGTLDGQTGQATLTLNRLALAPFNPYTTSAAGYRLGGTASLETKFRMRGQRYETNNRVTLHALDVYSRDPGDFERRFGVPLEVALALLRDPAGNIALSVPVTVDEKGARTGVGSIVAGALRQALVGALTSPLKLLGSVGAGVGGLLGGGGGIAPIANEPGEATPEPGQAERYEGVVRLLAERPQLGLRLRGRTGDADRPLVAQRILAERIEAGQGLPEIADGAGFLARRRISRALEERARGEEGALDAEDEALLQRYVATVQVPDDRLAALARARAEAARDVAVQEFDVAPERLAIGDPAPAGPPGVVLELAAAGG